MSDRDIQREERAIYLIILAAIAPVIIALAIHRDAIDSGGTLSLIVAGLGVIGLIAGLRAFRSKIPRARALSKRDR